MAETATSTPSPLRVLHLGKYFPPRYGGIETFMSQLMKAQQRAGLEVAAIVHNDSPCLATEDWHGCTVYHVRSYGQLVYAPVAPGFGPRLFRVLHRWRPHVVHIHMPNLSAFWLLLLKPFLPKSKWVVHWHADVLGAAPDRKVKLLYPLYRLFEGGLLTTADTIICTSPNYLQTSEPLKSYRVKCVVVPLGIDIEEAQLTHHDSLKQADSFVKGEAANDIKPAPLRLLMIGRLTYYKGHSILFEAIRRLRDKGISLSLDVIGEGEQMEVLKRYIGQHGLQEQIILHGAVSERAKERLLSCTDLLCLPSIERTEAFGVVLLEAAAHFKPALVTDVVGSGMSYVVENEMTGLIVKAGSVQSLADVLQQLDRQGLEIMGQAARSRLHCYFDIRRICDHIHSLYRELFAYI